MNKAPQTLPWGQDISTPSGRRWAWAHFFLKDHHIIRQGWWNLHQVAEGVWRSNQPSPKRLARYKALGIRTVVSLRGAVPTSYNLFEREACAQLGLTFCHIRGLGARALPSAQTIIGVADALAQVEGPFVMHCKSGADRTGFAAALYLILVEDRPVTEAAEQLARKYIHFKRSKSGVLDHVFRVYLRDVAPDGQGFRAWLLDGYDPDAIAADFQNWRVGADRWA